jgi:selenocysteine lyase/cysteine desulfurase
VDAEVPLLDGTRRPYVYLDNAASTPAFRCVLETVEECLRWYSSVHRGAGFKSLISTHAYERAREVVLEFVGADRDAHTCIFGKNTTEAINKLAYRIGLEPGDVVLTTIMEHHSNDLPWRVQAEVVHAGVDRQGVLDMEDLERKLELYSGRVKVVAATGASNVTGYTPPIHRIAELAHAHGALVVADCAQLAPHRKVDMRPVGAPDHLDFVALSGHKMYAPFGTGALIGPRQFFRRGAPEYRGGGTIDIVTVDEVYWADPPDREEAGSPNVVGAVALAASIQVLNSIGMEVLATHERDLTGYLLERLSRIDAVEVYGISDPQRLDERLGVVSFSVKGIPHGKVAAILGFEGGIGVRNGCFCAHPYILRLLDVRGATYDGYKLRVLSHDRTELPGLVRVSFGCYNTRPEIDHLVAMLERVVSGGYQGDYQVERESGFYWPTQFDPALLDAYVPI